MRSSVCLVAVAAMETHDRAAQMATGGMGMRTADMSEKRAWPDATYSYPGTIIAGSDNYCFNMETNLQGQAFGGHSKVAQCSASNGDETACKKTYIRRAFDRADTPGMVSGDVVYTECTYSGSECILNDHVGAQHNCTWTNLMEDLIGKHADDTDYCFGEVLESRRSTDGLAAAVRDTYDAIMVQNAIIEHNNVTIRDLLRDQQDLWTVYINEQDQCINMGNNLTDNQLTKLYDELQELESIARPDIRSAVNLNRGEGYQEGRREGYQEGGRIGFVELQSETTASMEAKACAKFQKLVHRVQKHHKVKLLGHQNPRACDKERLDLQDNFTYVYKTIAEMYDNLTDQIALNRSICLTTATYEYKSAVEGYGGIDERIQQAAENIHAAQAMIARLEPRFHDVEHAHARMDKHLESLKAGCQLDDVVEESLKEVRKRIRELQECPGRNDFVIEVPHWVPGDVTTPAPTPWQQGVDYQVQKAGPR